MKTALPLTVAAFGLAAFNLSATTNYVSLESTNPVPPYTNWTTAATNIQDAVDKASDGDTVLVANGVYATGGRAVGANLLVNRVAVDKPITLQSVNGPTDTIIQGYQVPGTTNGDGAIRCVYLADGATLSGFTLTNGGTRGWSGDWSDSWNHAEYSGGGVWCESASAAVSNCVLTMNAASMLGGGSFSGTLKDCSLSGNSARYSGGAAGGTLGGCTLTGNRAIEAGGGSGPIYVWDDLGRLLLEQGATLNNCTLTANSADAGGGVYAGTLNNCTLTGNLATSGGVVRVEPIIVRGRVVGQKTIFQCAQTNAAAQKGGGGADHSKLYNCELTRNSGACGGGASQSTLNNCTVVDNQACCGGGVFRGALNNCIVYYNTGHAENGTANYNDETTLNYSCTTPLPTAGIGNTTNEPAFVHQAYDDLRLRYGSPCLDTGTNLSAIITNDRDGHPRPLDGNGDGIASFDMGAYECVPLRRYVWQDSPSPARPYTDWATAAHTIQDAVDAAQAGDMVLVVGGVYDTGGRAVVGTMTNRVAIDKAICVESLMGPEVTVIQGYQLPGTTNGDGAVRCVYLANGATLTGFTLTNGATRSEGDDEQERSGGGLWCESTNAIASGCELTRNVASLWGGGAYGGTLTNCSVTRNSAKIGGGVAESSLYSCTLNQNAAELVGGAAATVCLLDDLGRVVYYRPCGPLCNCTLTENSALFGGGAFARTLNNCTLTGNSASRGGGAKGGTLNNCTLTGNLAEFGGGAAEAVLNNCALSSNSAINGQGGGADFSTLNACTLSNNVARCGGGALGGTLNNCALIGNMATDYGGGESASILTNCTLTGNSATIGGGGAAPFIEDRFGTPLFGESVLLNCTLTGNSAGYGGGAYGVRLTNCIITSNVASGSGGGVYQSTLNICTLTGNSADTGGGVAASILYSCVLNRNSARRGGGGVGPIYSCDGFGCCTLVTPGGEFYDCMITENSAAEAGGGVYGGGLMYNCTFTANTATIGGAVAGRENCTGVGIPCILTNCIVYYNTAANSPNYFISTLSYSCTTPLPSNGVGNITNEPVFVNVASGDFHLQSNSPCINAGNNSCVTTSTDLDGRPRIVGGTVDIGAYEFQGPFIAWLAQYGLPTDGSADFTHSDSDGQDNWQEYEADTDPTNAASCLRLTILSNTPPVAVTFSSSAARLYTLQCCTNLTPSSVWSTVAGQTDVLGSGDVLTLTDTNPPAPAFYRVSVKFP